MQALNELLFASIGAGAHPAAWWLQLALLTSSASAWLIVGILATCALPDRSRLVDVALALACAGLTAVLSHAIADWLDTPRPFMVGLSPDHALHGGRGGLPSTHASVMFAVTTFLVWRPQLRTAGLLVGTLALATGWARTYLGVHFPFDVAGGLVLGIVCGTAAAWLRSSAQRAGHGFRNAPVGRVSPADPSP